PLGVLPVRTRAGVGRLGAVRHPCGPHPDRRVPPGDHRVRAGHRVPGDRQPNGWSRGAAGHTPGLGWGFPKNGTRTAGSRMAVWGFSMDGRVVTWYPRE